MSGENVRAWDAARERRIRDLHHRMRDAEVAIKQARQQRNAARLPLVAEVARAVQPTISAEAEKLIAAVGEIRTAVKSLGEVAQIRQGFAITDIDKMPAMDGYTAPELAALPSLDLRPLTAIEHFARRLRGERVL